ncbi:MAG: L-fucose:H+ symporter permease [Bacteroidales bacterium]|jgi:FHS family L-fucose permease-like MFS transporter|nr:L-fucose:H+ symporter permease [Bacteroidales bacterium]MBQ2531645.1 L-fucose:H+ symporter permease [Bacteroidales bacterium]MBQ5410786.1 L-fucose:H+ symporter permease [Bacteroidales bacterium]MEE3475813.1 L-fucose:H+ symporter permease [Candidatus Cryptobacteroides sp.]
MTKTPLVERKYLFIFILITTLFALWGFANDITNPMVAAFQTVMELSAAKASLVQFAFYGGYATMAIPAALFIRKHSYKSGILMGLALYAIGAFLFIPAAQFQQFSFFCISLYILTFGLAFLETTANPFILSLGAKENATRRLNLSQSFNPMGSLLGMSVASFIVLPQLLSDKRDAAGNIIFPALSEAEKADIRLHDLAIIRNPYVIIGLVVLAVLIIIACTRVPKTQVEPEKANSTRQTLSNLWHNKLYREGVLTQMFYVAAQIMTWTFIIQYADNLGINKATAQTYNIVAMGLFLCGRFIATALMKYVNTSRLLAIFAACAALCAAGAILIVGKGGLYCLIGISAFMSLMFPTIYGIALENVDNQDASLGAAFLVEAIVGGAIMPPLQGMIIDKHEIFGHPAVNVSFILPLLCFVIVLCYGIRSYRLRRKAQITLN